MKEAVVYFISGLGADDSVWDAWIPINWKYRLIHWDAISPSISFDEYINGLISQIDIEKGVVLVGVSFGGVVAQEIALKVKCERVYIVSSIKSSTEKGPYLRLIQKLHLFKLTPILWPISKYFIKVLYLLFGIKELAHKIVFDKIIKNTDADFVFWASQRLLAWENKELTCPIVHFHGDSDLVFPSKSIVGCEYIEDGGHFMVYTHATLLKKRIDEDLSINSIPCFC